MRPVVMKSLPQRSLLENFCDNLLTCCSNPSLMTFPDKRRGTWWRPGCYWKSRILAPMVTANSYLLKKIKGIRYQRCPSINFWIHKILELNGKEVFHHVQIIRRCKWLLWGNESTLHLTPKILLFGVTTKQRHIRILVHDLTNGWWPI